MKHAASYLLPVILFTAMIACSNTNDPVIDEDLLDMLWRVDTLQTPEEEIVPGPDTLMTLRFHKSMRIDAVTPCNDYTGTYEINQLGSLGIDWHTWTEKACSAGPALRRGVLEGRFIQALNNASVYDVNEGTLTLYNTDHRYVVKLKHE
ncbi:MAG: META domain-containing protein [Candidatus Marinimicrobia bacterium]|nr:META domain-containing protein [Candidatus Neomarinimicrobiota bacterium]